MSTAGLVEEGRGPSIQVASGGFFPLLDPRPEDIRIGDIAAALSKLCRYTGHTRQFYSVAQHSVLCSHLVPPEDAMEALLHDATEAYIGDISRPLKRVLDLRAPGVVCEIEDNIAIAIAQKFGLMWPWPKSVKHADNVALATERRDLMPDGPEWPGLPEPHPDRIVPLPPVLVKGLFLRRYERLRKEAA